MHTTSSGPRSHTYLVIAVVVLALGSLGLALRLRAMGALSGSAPLAQIADLRLRAKYYVSYRQAALLPVLTKLLARLQPSRQGVLNQRPSPGTLALVLFDVDAYLGDRKLTCQQKSPGALQEAVCRLRFNCAAVPPSQIVCDVGIFRSMTAFVTAVDEHSKVDVVDLAFQGKWEDLRDKWEEGTQPPEVPAENDLYSVFQGMSGGVLAHEVAHLELRHDATHQLRGTNLLERCDDASASIRRKQESVADSRALELLKSTGLQTPTFDSGIGMFVEWASSLDAAALASFTRSSEEFLDQLAFASHPHMTRRAILFAELVTSAGKTPPLGVLQATEASTIGYLIRRALCADSPGPDGARDRRLAALRERLKGAKTFKAVFQGLDAGPPPPALAAAIERTMDSLPTTLLRSERGEVLRRLRVLEAELLDGGHFSAVRSLASLLDRYALGLNLAGDDPKLGELRDAAVALLRHTAVLHRALFQLGSAVRALLQVGLLQAGFADARLYYRSAAVLAKMSPDGIRYYQDQACTFAASFARVDDAVNARILLQVAREEGGKSDAGVAPCWDAAVKRVRALWHRDALKVLAAETRKGAPSSARVGYLLTEALWQREDTENWIGASDVLQLIAATQLREKPDAARAYFLQAADLLEQHGHTPAATRKRVMAAGLLCDRLRFDECYAELKAVAAGMDVPEPFVDVSVAEAAFLAQDFAEAERRAERAIRSCRGQEYLVATFYACASQLMRGQASCEIAVTRQRDVSSWTWDFSALFGFLDQRGASDVNSCLSRVAKELSTGRANALRDPCLRNSTRGEGQGSNGGGFWRDRLTR